MSLKSVYNGLITDLMLMKSKQSMIWLVLVVMLCCVNMKAMAFVYLLTFVSQTFIYDEKGVCSLYFAPVSKKSAVFGRYVFSMGIFAVVLVLSIATDYVAPVFYAEYAVSSVSFYAIIYAVYMILISVQLPALYWGGYAKVKILQFSAIFAAFFISSRMSAEDSVYSMVAVDMSAVAAAALVATVAAVCSALLSVRIFEAKNL